MRQHETAKCAVELRALLAELGVEVVSVEADQSKSGRWRVSADAPHGVCVWVDRVEACRAPWPWWLRWLPMLPRTRLEWAVEITDHGYGQAWAMGPTLRGAVTDCVKESRDAGSKRLAERLEELKQWDE